MVVRETKCAFLDFRYSLEDTQLIINELQMVDRIYLSLVTSRLVCLAPADDPVKLSLGYRNLQPQIDMQGPSQNLRHGTGGLCA